MKTLAALLIVGSCLSAFAQDAGDSSSSKDESSPSTPSPKIHFASGLIPNELQAGLQVGWQASRFHATSDYRSLIEPTAAEEGPFQAMSWGVVVSARWRSGFSLSLAPRSETYGERTQEETVTFAGNPFPHQLKSNTELHYTVWPLLAGMGWFTSRQHVQVQLGPYTALYNYGSVVWTVDGEPYGGRPNPIIRESVGGWMLTTEYGYRVGRGELVVGLETQRADESAMEGMRGAIKPEGAMVRVGYAYSLMRR